MKKLFPFLLIALGFTACNTASNVDLIVYNAKIYTVDSSFSVAEAMAIKDGKIAAVGTTKDITANYSAKEKIDASGKVIYPGLIDAHSHFYRYGLGLQTPTW